MIEWLWLTARNALHGLLWPLHQFAVDGSSRYYWVYCVTGLLMAAYATRGRAASTNFQTTLLSREVWLSRSARNDYAVLVLGAVLRTTILAWAFLNWEDVADWIIVALHAIGVSGTANTSSALELGGALTLTLFIADDILRWYTHYLMHRIPELWEFHKVHHSAEVLNFATAERIHPLEVVLTSLAGALGIGLVNGLFIAFFGNELTVQTVFGANACLVLFNLAGGVLRHSPFWISFGPHIERWVISPAMHQIHHSNQPRHFEKNLGSSLAVWDRMLGTLHIPQGREISEFGIGAETAEFRSLAAIYFRPFTKALRVVARRMRNGDVPRSPTTTGDRNPTVSR